MISCPGEQESPRDLRPSAGSFEYRVGDSHVLNYCTLRHHVLQVGMCELLWEHGGVSLYSGEWESGGMKASWKNWMLKTLEDGRTVQAAGITKTWRHRIQGTFGQLGIQNGLMAMRL